MTLWTEGLFLNGYVEIERNGALNLFSIFGHIRDSKPLLHFDGDSTTTSDYGIAGYAVCNEAYDPERPQISGTYYVGVVEVEYYETGTFVATLVQ